MSNNNNKTEKTAKPHVTADPDTMKAASESTKPVIQRVVDAINGLDNGTVRALGLTPNAETVIDGETLATIVASGALIVAHSCAFARRLKRNGANDADVRGRDYGDRASRIVTMGGDESSLAGGMPTALTTRALTVPERLFWAFVVGNARVADARTFAYKAKA